MLTGTFLSIVAAITPTKATCYHHVGKRKEKGFRKVNLHSQTLIDRIAQMATETKLSRVHGIHE